MRYGKIYYYDRMGNKVQDEEPTVRDEVMHFSTGSPRNKPILSPPLNVLNAGPRATPPYEPSKQDLISMDAPAFAYGDDHLRHLGLDEPRAVRFTPPMPPHAANAFGIDPAVGDGMGGISAPLPPIISPLDDLKTFPDSTDAEFDKLARELARIDLDKDKIPDVIREDHQMRTTNDGVTRITHHRVTEDVELCEHCLMEDKAFRDAQEAALLKKKIGQHVDDVNLQFAKRKKHEDLLPMNTLPPFADRNGADREREMQAKLKYRRELEDEIERRRQAALYREEREKQMHNFSNTRDAHAFADDRQQRQRLEQEERKRNDESLRQQIELRNLVRREEEERLEWWERSPQRGAVVVERDKDHLMGQLRRNEALQHSVEMLEKFKRDRQEYEGMAKDAQRRQFDNLRDKISEQSALTRWQEPRRGSLDRGAAAAGPDPATQEAVYRSWQEAHLRNDRRYRVLQDIDAQRKQRQIETDIELKRCRRCHRPMHASRRVRIRDIAEPVVQNDRLQGPLEMFSPNI